ncbi:MAG: NHL repeat-containing protein, partial [Terracidiphilus sp.]
GLSSSQFEISTSEVSGSGPTTGVSNPTSTSATVTGEIYTTVSSFPLHGTGVGANIQAAPALESAIGGGLMTPEQIAVDGEGNAYVADPGLGKVLKFAAGSGTKGTPTAVGSGLTMPTGVAVDRAGDVFIADYTNNSGSVYEIASVSDGLVVAGGQITLVSGLGNNLSLAVDGLGNVYIADPSNKRVVKVSIGITGPSETNLTAGFNSPSYVATDANNSLYVVDGANLFELVAQPGNVLGAPTTLLSNLSGATGVAVDPSGAVYVPSAGGTVRIPSVNGSLAPTSETVIAQSVTNPDSVALDQTGNVYLADGTALNVHFVNINGALALPTPATLTSSTSASATITNIGNSSLTVTGYTSTNSVDYTGGDGTCIGDSPLAAGATCVVDVTFNPGAGEQGPLTGQIGITSNAVNSPILIDATGTGLTLANSAANFTVAGTAEVVNAPLTLTVASKSGTGAVPSGEVTISYQSWVSQNPAGCGNAPLPACVPTVIPVTNTVSATLDATGKATVNLAPILAGSQAVTVAYGGDRVFGRSTSTVTATVAKSAVTSITLPKFPDPSDINMPFVVPGTGSGTVPYDGSENPWQYQFNITVNTAIGAPTGTVTVMDDSTACPPGTSATGLGTAACVLANYSGTACPQQSGAATLTVQSSGTAPVGPVAFPTNCLWNVPSGITYSPVIFTHYIWPVYSGDANFLAYTGPTKTVLQAVRGPMVQITQTGNAASQTVAPTLTVQHGSSASINLTLTSILGYGIAGRNGQLNDSNFPVSLTCDVPIPHAECTVSYVGTDDPNQVTAPDSVQIPCPSSASTTEVAAGTVQCTPGLATVTLYTDVAVGTTTSQNARDASVTLGALFGFGMVGLFFRRRAFEKGHRLLMILLMIVGGALAVSVTACSTTNLSPQSSLASTPGTYPMTITASEVGTQTINLATGAVTIYGTQNQVSLPFVVNVTVQ